MRVLAVDTATERESVAVVAAGAVLGEVRVHTTEGHSRPLVGAVAFLIESLGLGAGEIDGYAVTTGPGSFTGLRIGISTVQGLALASRRPCLGISTLEVLASRIVGTADRLVAVMDAHRGQVFGQIFDREGRPLGAPLLEAPDAFFRELEGAPAFIGDGAQRYQQRIREILPAAAFPQRGLFLAATLGLMAERSLESGAGSGPEALRPLYLREADIRRSGS